MSSGEKAMNALLVRGGQAAGLFGILLIALSVAARLSGRYTLGDFQVGTLLLASVCAVSTGCFLLLWSIADQSRR
jgi:hypothetical protein